MKDKKICIAKIVSSHGIKGEVKIKTFLDDPNGITKFKNIFNKNGDKEFQIKGVRGRKNEFLIAKIKGCDDRNEADRLRGTEFYISRDELPETKKGQFYYNDLIGLLVVEDGKEIGVVKNVYNFGAGDILEIKLNNQKQIDIPFVIGDFVKKVDLKAGKIVIIQPEYV